MHAAAAIARQETRGHRARAGARIQRQPHSAVAAFDHPALNQAIRVDQFVHRLGFEAEHGLVEQQSAVELAARHDLRDVVDLGQPAG